MTVPFVMQTWTTTFMRHRTRATFHDDAHPPSWTRWRAASRADAADKGRAAAGRMVRFSPLTEQDDAEDRSRAFAYREICDRPLEEQDVAHTLFCIAVLAGHWGIFVVGGLAARGAAHLGRAVASLTRGATTGCMMADGTAKVERPTPLTIRRARVNRRGVRCRSVSTQRIRARCRRLEAWVLAYLAVTNHILGHQPNGRMAATNGPTGGALRQTREAGMEEARSICDEVLLYHADGTAYAYTPGWRHCGRKAQGEWGSWWNETSRIGEADNPGPMTATMTIDRMLRRVYDTARCAVAYPRPGSRTLRGAIAPGFQDTRRSEDAEEKFALGIESVNTTGWRGLQRRLASSQAHVILAQETWITQDAIPAASAWARRRGWKSIWTSARPGPSGGASGGVAIFARDYLGLRYPPDGTHEWCPGHVVAAVLDAPAHRPLLLASCYLVNGVGPTKPNLDILAAIGQRKGAVGGDYGFVMGGDLNMEPPALAATGFEGLVEATILVPMTSRGTFRSPKASSLIDFYVASERVAAAVDSIATVEGTGNRGHVPVLMKFRPCVTTLRALYLRRPPRLEVQRVHGPIAAPPRWAEATELAVKALGAARDRSEDTQAALDAAYAAWADLAELEVANYTGADPRKFGQRSRPPNLVWRSVVPEGAPEAVRPRAAAAAWLGGVIGELIRICDAVQDGGGHAELDDDFRDDPSQPAGDVDADGLADAERRHARARRPPVARDACARVAGEIATSLWDDFPAQAVDEEDDVLGRMRDRVETCATAIARSAFDGERGTPQDGGDDVGSILREQRALLEAMRDEARAVEARSTAQANAEDRRKWKDWVSEGVEGGAARAHAYTRNPKAWAPTVARLPDGTPSAAVEHLLEDQRAKYCKCWKPAARAFHYRWEDADELPPISIERLREVSSSFSEATATTFDGFHPRHISCLSEEALQSLSLILAAVEASAMWPTQVSLIVAALLPKPAGGFRPIGLAPAVYRVWSKARRLEADAWEKKYPRAFFSACKGAGPVDAVWRLSAMQEAGTAEGEVAATISEDLQSFFETLDRQRLVDEARALGFPMPILRAALAAYSAPRMVSMGGRIAREVFPTAGVVAGCSLAMALTKVYCLRAFDDFTARAPAGTRLGTFVDDLTLSAIGTPVAVREDLAEAHGLLAEIVRDQLHCEFAPGKTAITATNRGLAAAVARGAGVTGAVTTSATLLGIDNTAAAPRAALRGRSKKGARLKAALARRKRLGQVSSAIGSRARKIFVAGVQPAAAFGGEIWGLDEGETAKLRRLAAVALRPHGRGRSLQITLLWHDLPTAAAELAPIHQLSRMAWSAMVQRDDAAARGSSIADLRRWWQSAKVQFDPLVRQYERLIADAACEGKDVSKAAARKIWGKVRGPMGAAALTATKIGWTLAEPLCLQDQHGAEMLLTNSSPALIRRLTIGALRLTMEKRLASRWAEEEPQFHGRAICTDFVTAAVKNARDLTPHQRGIMRAVTCGALMTGARAVRMGYLVSGLCPLCGQAADTLTHRVYECACTAHAVSSVVPRWFWQEAKRAAAGNRFWTTGVCPSPADVAPLPALDLTVMVERMGACTGIGDAGGSDLTAVCGRTYFDGSATTPTVKRLARAACAVVETNDQGEPSKVLTAAVPRHLPQTAQAAEYMGLALNLGALRGPTDVVGDCLNVVRAANGQTRMALAHNRMYAGVLLSTYARPEQKRWAGVVRWTRAHRKPTGAESARELMDIKGNDAADAAAKEALKQHPLIGADAEAQMLFAERRIKHVVRAVITALEFFPKAPGDMARAPKPENEAQAKERRRHHWVHKSGAWRCTLCNDWANGSHLHRARMLQRCRGKTLADDAHCMAGRGHLLYRADAMMPIVYCGNCGAWGHRRTHHLSAPCQPPRASGIQALRRIHRGLHPLQRRGPKGVLMQRERIRTVARFDDDERCWVSMSRDAERGGDAPTTTPDHALTMRRCDGDDNAVGHGTDAIEDMDCGTAEEGGVTTQAHHEDDEYDVFGHGGSLDEEALSQEIPPGDDDAAPVAEAERMQAEEHQPMEVAARSLKRGTQSIRQRSEEGTALAAIRRMMEGSRPASSDAANRIRAVRQRVIDRLRGEPAQHPTAHGSFDDDGQQGDGRGLCKRRRRESQGCDEGAASSFGSRTIDAGSGERGEGEVIGGDRMEYSVLAMNANNSVDATREGPGDPSPSCATASITQPASGACVVDTVAGGVVVASFSHGDYAREEDSDRGKATYGPPRGAAAPREDTEGTSGVLQGRDFLRSSLAKPLAASGGRPHRGREMYSPQNTPKRLGAGPSTSGRAEGDEIGRGPATREKARRRDGGVDPATREPAARGSGDAAGLSRREMPLEGIHRRAPSARNECDTNRHERRRRTAADLTEAGDAGPGEGSKKQKRSIRAEGYVAERRPCSMDNEGRSAPSLLIDGSGGLRAAQDEAAEEGGTASARDQPWRKTDDGAAADQHNAEEIAGSPVRSGQEVDVADSDELEKVCGSTSGRLRPCARRHQRQGGPNSSPPQPRHRRPHGRGTPWALSGNDVDHVNVHPSSSNLEGTDLIDSSGSPVSPPPSPSHARRARPAAPARARSGARQRGLLVAAGSRRDAHEDRGEVFDRGAAADSAHDREPADDDGRHLDNRGDVAGVRPGPWRDGVSDGRYGRLERRHRWVLGEDHRRHESGGGQGRQRGAAGTRDEDMGGGGPNHGDCVVAINGEPYGGNTGNDGPSGANAGEAEAPRDHRREEGLDSTAEHAADLGGAANAGKNTCGDPGAGDMRVAKRRRLRGKQPVHHGLAGNSLHDEFSGGPPRSSTSRSQRCLVADRGGPLLTAERAGAGGCGSTSADPQAVPGGDLVRCPHAGASGDRGDGRAERCGRLLALECAAVVGRPPEAAAPSADVSLLG